FLGLHLFPPVFPGGMVNKIEVGPIIETGPFEPAVGDGKAKLSHQMKLSAETDTGPPDVTGVGSNFRLYQNNVEWIFLQPTTSRKLDTVPPEFFSKFFLTLEQQLRSNTRNRHIINEED